MPIHIRTSLLKHEYGPTSFLAVITKKTSIGSAGSKSSASWGISRAKRTRNQVALAFLYFARHDATELAAFASGFKDTVLLKAPGRAVVPLGMPSIFETVATRATPVQ